MTISNQTFGEAIQTASLFLKQNHKDSVIAQFLMDDLMQWSLNDRLTNSEKMVPEDILDLFINGIKRIVLDDYPYQYVSQTAWFYGLPLKVTEDVLIPRQETEGIIETIIKNIDSGKLPSDAQVLDIGTGSGAIAIALKHEVPTLQVTATDISVDALTVAKMNAKKHDLSIRFLEGDLDQPILGETFDIIVTNPPYIAATETDVMGTDVIKYEPHLALFADDLGYAIYERLIPKLRHLLRPNGFFMAECGYRQARMIASHMQTVYPHYKVSIIKDYESIERFVTLEAIDRT